MVLRHWYGVTLLEALIALSVIAILATLAVPSYTQWRALSEFKSALLQASQLAKLARAVALNERRSITLVFDPQQPACIGLTDDKNCDCHQPVDCQIGGTTRQLSLQHYATSLATTDGKKKTLTFDGTHGLSFGHALSITLTKSPYRGQLIINNIGRVRYCTSSNINGFPLC